MPPLWPHSPAPAAGERRAGCSAVSQRFPCISVVFPMLPPSPGQCYLGSVCHKVKVLIWALPLRIGHVNVLSCVVNALVIPVREASMSPGCGVPRRLEREPPSSGGKCPVLPVLTEEQCERIQSQREVTSSAFVSSATCTYHRVTCHILQSKNTAHGPQGGSTFVLQPRNYPPSPHALA